MKREIVRIDRDLCNGCGECIPNCHEGALQIIDGKATLVSELMCDGLGACLGHCPLGAIDIEVREADAYDEVATVKEIIKNGKNVLIAHMCHLMDHDETVYLKEAADYIKANKENIDFSVDEVIDAVNEHKDKKEEKKVEKPIVIEPISSGCPGTAARKLIVEQDDVASGSLQSQLGAWPVQMHLINPNASYFKNSDLLLAADCVAFSMGDFHQNWLKGKTLAIACPKLDSNKEAYIEKLVALIDNEQVNTITVMVMEVPCCGGLLSIVNTAKQMTKRNVPVKLVTISIKGEVLNQEWI